MSRLKIISIEKTLARSEFVLPSTFYSASDKCLDFNKYPELEGVSEYIELSWLLYMSEDIHQDMNLTLFIRLTGRPFKLSKKFGNSRVEKLLGDVNDKLLTSYMKALNLALSPDEGRIRSLSTESNLELLDSLFLIKNYCASIEFEHVKPKFTLPELAAINLEYYDNLIYCLEMEQGRALLKNWEYNLAIDSVTDRQLLRIIKDEKEIRSQLARENQARSVITRYSEARQLVEAMAIEVYESSESRPRTRELARRLCDDVLPVFCHSKNLKIPKEKTVDGWIKAIAPKGVNKKGRPPKKG